MTSEKKDDHTNDKKPAPQKTEPYDILIANSLFPDASAVFKSPVASLGEAKDSACIVLDTNSLLVPYGIGAQTLAEIKNTYTRLIQQKRLAIPAQVAREFARNRVSKLAELHQKLSRRRSQLHPFQQGTYPLLESFGDYTRLREVEKTLDQLTNEYRNLISRIIDHVSSWEWNDPVSLLYAELFSGDVIVDTVKPPDEIRTEHFRRLTHKIPPGYKDQAKEDTGIGDFLIWMTILEIGTTRKSSLIFVTGEEKADWWHNSEQQQLYPRFELVDEYRRASGGRSFHIIRFSRLLELFGASTEVIAEVREEESMILVPPPLTVHNEMRMRAIAAEQAVASWLISSGFKISPAPLSAGYDYVVESDSDPFAVEIVHARRGSGLFHRLKLLQQRSEQNSLAYPLTVVVVGETMEILAEAEKMWRRLDPAFRLCTLLLTADERIEPVRPL